VYVTEHEPLLSIVQELGEKVPDGALNDTVPVGENPDTWAVTVVVPPTGTDDGLSETVVVVSDLTTVNAELPELATLFASPE